jgi:hypothetical protein
MRLGYATPVIALLIATAGVVGPVRAPNSEGREVITYWGWATIAGAAVTCAVALIESYQRAQDVRRERIRAEAAERELKVVRDTALAELAPAVQRLHDIVTFGFLLPHLRPDETQRPNATGEAEPLDFLRPDASSENPRHIPEALKLPKRLELDPLSAEWIQSLRKVNFIPRRGWSFPFRPLGSLDTFLNKKDPFETTAPYCLDNRQFHRIVSEEAAQAQLELKNALEKGAFIAFSSDVLATATKLIQDRYLRSLIELADWLERWIRIEEGLEDPTRMQLSMIDDRRCSIDDYKTFMNLLNALEEHFAKIERR